MMNLTTFLNASVNSVTRERLFHNRLYYDLKLAAAHRGYGLTLYQPEVDRDGFDIVLDDGDSTRFVQLKTVLTTSSTSTWDISRRFLRPDLVLAEEHGIEPAGAGKGGAVVLIEIDASVRDPDVRYRVTDFSLLRLLATTLGRRPARGATALRPLGPRSQIADATWRSIMRGTPDGKVRLNKSSFLRARDPAGLLSLLGLHSDNECHQPATRLVMAIRQGFRVDSFGDIVVAADPTPLAYARGCAGNILHAVDEAELAIHPTLQPIGQG